MGLPLPNPAKVKDISLIEKELSGCIIWVLILNHPHDFYGFAA
jgi:hypothetical protein